MHPEDRPKMAVYNPRLLCHKLCRLFDAGLSDVDMFARECELEPRLIERLARSEVPISVQTRHRIDRVLSHYYRKHPELFRDSPPASKRGVEEVVHRSRDWRGFEVTDSTGHVVMYVEWPKKKVTQARIDGLWRYLEREDPQPQLKVI
jgi:hypothetical protein